MSGVSNDKGKSHAFTNTHETADKRTSNILMNSMVNADGKQLNIYIREEDGYINATELCKSAGKTWSNYIRNKTTDEYMGRLESDLQIRRTDLIQENYTNNMNADRSTWVHQDVALHLATWLSPIFMRHCMKTITLFIKGELKVADVDDQVSGPIQQSITFDNEIQQNVKKINTIVDPECWIYIRGVHKYLFDQGSNVEADKARKLSKYLLKFGIADNLGKRDYTYGKDDGMFYYAIQLSSRKDATFIENLFRNKLKGMIVDKTFEYVDVDALKDYYRLQVTIEDLSTYAYLAKILFAHILLEIHRNFPESYGNRFGYELSLVERQLTLKNIIKPSSSKVIDLDQLEYQQKALDPKEIQEIQEYILQQYLKPGMKLLENKVETFDVYVQCTPEMISEEFRNQADLKTKPQGNWAYQPPRPSYKFIYQKISAHDLTTVVKSYKSLSEAAEDNSCTQQQIQDAIKDARLLNDHRWNRIDKDADPSKVPDNFAPTAVRQQKNTGEPVCMIHPTTNTIEKIYVSQRQASDDMGVSHGAICVAIKSGTNKSAGRLWKLLRNCTEKQIEDYEKLHGKWIPPIDNRDKLVRQIDPNTKMIVKEFPCMKTAAETLHCAPTKLKTAVQKKEAFRGFLWEMATNRP